MSAPLFPPGALRVNVNRAPSAATTVTLLSSNNAVTSVPPTVNVAAGALYADFPVSANAAGQATITATLNGSASALVTVSAPEVTTLTLSPQTPTAYTGDNIPFTATATLTDATTQNYTPIVTWMSSDSTTATIANTGANTGIASANLKRKQGKGSGLAK